MSESHGQTYISGVLTGVSITCFGLLLVDSELGLDTVDPDYFNSAVQDVTLNEDVLEDLPHTLKDITQNNKDLSFAMGVLFKMQEAGYEFTIDPSITDKGKLYEVDENKKDIVIADTEEETLKNALNYIHLKGL